MNSQKNRIAAQPGCDRSDTHVVPLMNQRSAVPIPKKSPSSLRTKATAFLIQVGLPVKRILGILIERASQYFMNRGINLSEGPNQAIVILLVYRPPVLFHCCNEPVLVLGPLVSHHF